MTEVSIIVPCYNEQKTIRYLLEAIAEQTYSLSKLEVIIADGNSNDGTIDVINDFATNNPNLRIKVVVNHKKIIPAALNLAIEASEGDILIRLDAHSIPSQNYVELCVRELRNGLGDNVGGVWDIKPQGDNIIARSIALAASHPVAVGDAQYRYTDKAAFVDTVPFGTFRRELFDPDRCFSV